MRKILIILTTLSIFTSCKDNVDCIYNGFFKTEQVISVPYGVDPESFEDFEIRMVTYLDRCEIQAVWINPVNHQWNYQPCLETPMFDGDETKVTHIEDLLILENEDDPRTECTRVRTLEIEAINDEYLILSFYHPGGIRMGFEHYYPVDTFPYYIYQNPFVIATFGGKYSFKMKRF